MQDPPHHPPAQRAQSIQVSQGEQRRHWSLEPQSKGKGSPRQEQLKLAALWGKGPQMATGTVSQHSDPGGNTDLLGFAVGLMSGNGDQQGESPVPVILSHHLNCYALPLAMPIPAF